MQIPERVLTIKQPWASLIIGNRVGHLLDQPPASIKDVENRSWNTDYRGPILIHAGKAIDKAAAAKWHGPYLTGILGLVDLVDVHPDNCRDCDDLRQPVPTLRCSPWAQEGQYHWRLANPLRFPEPIACPGALRLWRTSRIGGLEQQIIRQLTRTAWWAEGSV